MTDDIIKYLFLALAFVGVFIRYRINRREFNRRNAMGIQGFSSYEKARFTVFIEGIGINWFPLYYNWIIDVPVVAVWCTEKKDSSSPKTSIGGNIKDLVDETGILQSEAAAYCTGLDN